MILYQNSRLVGNRVGPYWGSERYPSPLLNLANGSEEHLKGLGSTFSMADSNIDWPVVTKEHRRRLSPFVYHQGWLYVMWSQSSAKAASAREGMSVPSQQTAHRQ